MELLRRSLLSVDTVSRFPRLDRGEGVPAVAVRQALIHEVLDTLAELERLPVSEEAWGTGAEQARAPILDLLLLGKCPETALAVLLDLLLAAAPYLSSTSMDQEMEHRGPLTWAPVQLLPQQSFY